MPVRGGTMKSIFAALAFASVLCTVQAYATEFSEAQQLCLRYEGRADPDAFIAACTKVIDADAWDVNARGTALANRALMYVQLKRYDLALADCETATRLDFDQVEFAYVACGAAQAGQGDHQAALVAFDRAIRAGGGPGWIDPYLGRASAHFELHDYDAAINDCNIAIAKKPDDERAFRLRGHVYLVQKQYSKALADFDTVLKLAPNSPGAGADRAEAKREMEAETQTQLPAATGSSPTPDDAMLLCTSTPGPKGSNQKRIDACTKVIEAAATPAQTRIAALKARGYLHGVEGQTGLLVADYEDASMENLDNPYRWLDRGDKHREAGQLDRAIADFGEAIRLNPKFAEAYQHRCLLRSELGEPADVVIADCDTAVSLRPNDPQMSRTRARVLVELGLYAKAIAELDTQLALYPGDLGPTLYRCQARAFWGRDLDLALADCDKLAGASPQFRRCHDCASHHLLSPRSFRGCPVRGDACTRNQSQAGGSAVHPRSGKIEAQCVSRRCGYHCGESDRSKGRRKVRAARPDTAVIGKYQMAFTGAFANYNELPLLV